MKGIIQIAGICGLDEAQMLLSEGVDWLGFPFHLPVHRQDLSIAHAGSIVAQIDSASCVLITYLHSAKAILKTMRDLGIKKVQLHGSIKRSELISLKQFDPRMFVVNSIIIKGQSIAELQDEMNEFNDVVDAFLTDTYDPETGAAGATGKTHDWKISAELVKLSRKPLLLAGGLNPENVAEAIACVRPFGVDAHTGVEDDSGKKSQAKVKAFVEEARAAFDLL